MTPLTWTSTPPTVAGGSWYWRSYGGDGWAFAKVRQTHDGTLYVYFAFRDGEFDTLAGILSRYPACQWAGPIPVPQEPT